MTDILADLPTGFTTRPVEPADDLAAVVELCNAAAIAEYGLPDVDERLIRESYQFPGFKAERDSLLVLDAAGNAAGLGEFYDNEEEHVAPFFFARVRPDLLDSTVPDHVLAWGAERAPANLPLAEAGTRVAMHSSVAAVNAAMITAYERAGWHHERTSWTMEIDLREHEVPAPEWPEGITLRTADLDRDAHAIHAAENDAFSDHYGFLASSFEDWWHFRTRFFVPEPALWFLAMDGEEIAGMALCSSQRIGQPDLGWVSTLGVRRAWRRRGLGLAILQHSFRELQKRGKPRAGLGVDAQSLTGATRLYERAGMRVVREAREYELLIRDGREVRTLAVADA
jgi:ribosomal protein S18 acetylase RimI-like enzyme